jgi:hypothetical protein
VKRSVAPKEDPEGGRKTPFPSEGGGVMTFLYCRATHTAEREKERERESERERGERERLRESREREYI